MGELCGIASRIACNRVLSFKIKLTRGFIGKHYLETERFEKTRPNGKLLVHTKLQRKPYASSALGMGQALDAVDKPHLLICEYVEIIHYGFSPRAALALVT